MLQLLSLTLAYDDTRFFGSVMFTDPTHPDDNPAAVLVDHTDEPPWFRLTNVDPDGQDRSVPAMVEAERIMRFLLRYTPERIGRTPADFPQP
ncbi:hypothetical protein GCM10017714_19030 [Curtobacterium pusillum]|jgi:hypothetical protein|uniref:Uncharacterized protein n=1 Tax=Curtobacterium pusillum TaxID=69373 RepID=A0AAW3TEX4_9MICO|nr:MULTISPECIES: hypothetical protein [Curtobacterium]MBA8992163.1 hypothetical protein [Curtobacterium pusillum]MDT0234394.1 hypothetical protein [Curtobacterium sp. BRB10]NUU12686.1 hypothetical protein [Curtobacterium pusillum]OII24247.1 hypothetical protein BIV03_10500 [Curtobacterium sp. MCBA15_016]PCN49602.1 hypothetical protein Csp2054_01245 [Curtobacterium sp. 'Ferrero']